ncbi:MAG: hypothetical protein CM15mP83_6870 [Flavobacteriaceae bacterium]|nr:MAG: hypothetical protein CM15mP83_6870 [Flavobacteriaceae bacterium]
MPSHSFTKTFVSMYWEYSTFGEKTSPSLFTAENGGNLGKIKLVNTIAADGGF